MVSKWLEGIIEFYDSLDYSDIKNVRLDECTVVEDVRGFSKSHISYLLSNSGKRRFKPYAIRLEAMREILKENEWRKISS